MLEIIETVSLYSGLGFFALSAGLFSIGVLDKKLKEANYFRNWRRA